MDRDRSQYLGYELMSDQDMHPEFVVVGVPDNLAEIVERISAVAVQAGAKKIVLDVPTSVHFFDETNDIWEVVELDYEIDGAELVVYPDGDFSWEFPSRHHASVGNAMTRVDIPEEILDSLQHQHSLALRP